MKYRLNWTMITIHTFGAVLSGTAFLLCVAGCENNAITGTYTWPLRAEVPVASFMPKEGGASVQFGGYGSDLVFSAVDTTFWLLTDRGPNVDGSETDSKVFPFPEFIPHVGIFRCEGEF